MTTRHVPEVCRDGHHNPDIGLYCVECGCLIVISADAFQHGRRALTAYIAMLVISTVVGIVLFRISNTIWAPYTFLTIGIICLYATVFSRGASVAVAAWSLAAFSAVWTIWAMWRPVFHADPIAESIIISGSIAVWLGSAAYFLYLGQRMTLPSIRSAATLFMTLSALIFGFLGLWIVLLQRNLAYPWVYQCAALALGAAPLLAIAALLIRRRGDGGWATTAAFWLFAVAAYSGLAQYVLRAAGFVLGHLLPRILGLPELPDREVVWISALQWRGAVTSIPLIAALITVLVSSAVEVASRFQAHRPDFFVTQMADIQARLAGNREFLARSSLHLQRTTLTSMVSISVASDFILKVTVATATNVTKLAARVLRHILDVLRYLVGPMFALSVLGLAVILVVAEFRAYGAYGALNDPQGLWGAAIVTMIFIPVLCGLAIRMVSHWNDQREGWHQPLFALGSAVAFLGGLFYFLVSVVTLAMMLVWLAFKSVEVPLDPISPGPVYRTNLIAVALAVGALLVLALAQNLTWLIRRRGLADKYQVGSAVMVVLAFVILASSLGIGPLYRGVAGAISSGDAADEGLLRAQIPTSIEGSCRQDTLVTLPSRSSLACHSSIANARVFYHLFDSPAEAEERYFGFVDRQALVHGSAFCAGEAIGESGYYINGQPAGRVACYGDEFGTWIAWTQLTSSVLVVAVRPDGQRVPLAAAWSSGAMGPTAPRTN